MKQIIGIVLLPILLLTGCAREETTWREQDDNEGMSWQEQYNLGVRYLTEGNYREAVLAFTAAIEIEPQKPEAYIGRAQAAVFSGETEENLSAARADYEDARDLGGTSAEVWLGLADIYIRAGEYDEALETLKEGLDKIGHDEAIIEKIAELESGTITDATGKTRKESKFDSSGELMWYHEYDYDAEGRPVSVTAYDGGGAQIGYLEYRYTPEGLPENGLITDSDTGKLGQFIREFDDSGNITKVSYFNADGDLWMYSTSENDPDNHMSRTETFDANGMSRGYEIFEYNDEGKRKKSIKL